MKNTATSDEKTFTYESVFDNDDCAPQLNIYQKQALADSSVHKNAVYLDKILAAVKWVFLYLPGTASIHFIMLGFGLMFFYKDWSVEVETGMLGIFIVSAFMVMLGIGKLSELRYLKLVGGITLTSLLFALLYVVLASFLLEIFSDFLQKSLFRLLF